MHPRHFAAALALVCALACSAREPASPEQLAELYFARLAEQDLAALETLYAPAFLASMEQKGAPWRTRLTELAERRGPLQGYQLQTQRTLPAADGVPRIELTYRVTCERARGIEQLTVRPPLQEGERFQIVEHAISS